MIDMRVGIGTDIHRLGPGRPLIIGGVEIASDLGSIGHSDADVLLHSITDAVLGALALGNIGDHFPNSDERWRDADSRVFLGSAVEMMRQAGYELANMDSVINLESPMLGPYIDRIRSNVADLFAVQIGQISVKAKSGEKVDAVGERRAVSATVTILIRKAG